MNLSSELDDKTHMIHDFTIFILLLVRTPEYFITKTQVRFPDKKRRGPEYCGHDTVQ